MDESTLRQADRAAARITSTQVPDPLVEYVLSENRASPSGPAADTEQRGADACVRYGFCVPVCPTYQVLGGELDGPRGRIALIREMYASNLPPTESTVRHLDQCLSCSACMKPCAAGVPYRSIIDEARSYIEARYTRPLSVRLQRILVLHGLTRPLLARVSLKLAALLPAASLRLLPEFVQPFVATARRARPIWRKRDVAAMQGVPPGTRPLSFLLEGCVQNAVAPRINDAAARLFSRNGVPLVRSRKTRCCGALALHMGRPDLAREHGRALIRELRSHGTDAVDRILTTATGCLAVLREYDHLFAGQPEEADAKIIARIAADPVTVAASFDDLCRRRDIAIPVAVHEPCSQRLLPEGAKACLSALRSAGVDVAVPAEAHMCCGSAGSYSLLQPEISEALGRRRADQIDSLKAEAVVTANIGCLMQLDRFTGRRPFHVIELLDWLNGGPEPPELAGWQNWPKRTSESTNTSGGVW